MKPISTFAPGKIIISGEHSVVYGQPALVTAIDKGVTVKISKGQLDPKWHQDQYLEQIFNIWSLAYPNLSTDFNLEVISDLPQKSGLGSSAAFASGVFQALALWHKVKLSQQELFNLVKQAEHFHHLTSSGVDPAAVVYGGLLTYRKTENEAKINRFARKTQDKLNFLVIDSGSASESTGEMVAHVRNLTNDGQKYQQLINDLGIITTQLIENIKSSQLNLELISANQRLLEKINVVGSKAQIMINQLENLGAVAKISGAGGLKTGSGMILCFANDLEAIKFELNQKGWPFLEVRI